MSKKEISDSLNEIRFLASIRHKNIVGFLEAFLENNETELCIIMEYCGCGDLAQKVERYKRRKTYIDEDVIWRYLIQSLKALAHLHEKGICHRDLKTANSFLAEDGAIKIGDMNVSKRLKGGKGQLQTQIGTPYYMSPEIWNNRPYNESSDMWSLGCMMYELCALHPPFVADSFPALKRAVTAGRYSPVPRKFTDALSKVIAVMLKLNPSQRPSAQALLDHPDVQKKMHLDGAVVPREPMHAFPGMMQTIKVPQNLAKLGANLPKPCYADARPNSPSAWVVAEQVQAEKQQRKAEAKAEAAEAAAIQAAKAAAELHNQVISENAQPSAPAPAVPPMEHKIPKAPPRLERMENAENVPVGNGRGRMPRAYKESSAAAAAPPAPPVPQSKFSYGGVGGAPAPAPTAQAANPNPYNNKGGHYDAKGHYVRPMDRAGGYQAAAAPSGGNGHRYGIGQPSAAYGGNGYYPSYGGRAAGQPSRAYPHRMW